MFIVKRSVHTEHLTLHTRFFCMTKTGTVNEHSTRNLCPHMLLYYIVLRIKAKRGSPLGTKLSGFDCEIRYNYLLSIKTITLRLINKLLCLFLDFVSH